MADDNEPCVCRAGMRAVTDVWARQEAGIPRDTDMAALNEQAAQERAAIEAALTAKMPHPDSPAVDLVAKYAAALNTVFPCPTCRPGQFARWRNGCYRAGHQAKRCQLCKDAKK